MPKKDQEKIVRLGHNTLPFFGRGQAMAEADSLRLIRKLITDVWRRFVRRKFQGYVMERLYNTKFDSTVAYAEVTDKGKKFASGLLQAKVGRRNA